MRVITPSNFFHSYKFLFFFYRLYQRGMDEGGGDGHDAFYVDHYPTVAADADELADNTLEDAASDAYTLTLDEVELGRLDVENGFIVGPGNQDEAAHLFIGNDNGGVLGTVHDVADGDAHAGLVLQGIDAGTGGMNEDQVVDGGDKLAQATAVLLHIFIVHRDEALDVLGIQIFF